LPIDLEQLTTGHCVAAARDILGTSERAAIATATGYKTREGSSGRLEAWVRQEAKL